MQHTKQKASARGEVIDLKIATQRMSDVKELGQSVETKRENIAQMERELQGFQKKMAEAREQLAFQERLLKYLEDESDEINDSQGEEHNAEETD